MLLRLWYFVIAPKQTKPPSEGHSTPRLSFWFLPFLLGQAIFFSLYLSFPTYELKTQLSEWEHPSKAVKQSRGIVQLCNSDGSV